MNLAIPWRAGILPFLASHWVVVIRFLATSFSRTLTTIAVIFLIREFLSGVLADRHGVADFHGRTRARAFPAGISGC